LPHSPTRIHINGWFVSIGICCYLLLLTLTGLAHHHGSDSLHDDKCPACLFSANHIAVAPAAADLVHPQTCIYTPPLLLPVFLPTIIPSDVLGRAPPISSI
jgi:hypothetical protein